MKIKRFISLWIVVLWIGVPAFGQSGETAAERLTGEIARLEKATGGVVGVGALHLQSGEWFTYNEDVRFPMASTYKVPIAVQLLSRVEKGKIALSDMIAVEKSDLHPGSGTISRLLDDPGVVLSLHNLLELMLLISDNSATDLCIKAAGGTEAVTHKMREIGIEDLDVNRPTYVLIAHFLGVTSVSKDVPYDDDKVGKKMMQLSKEEREQAEEAFEKDPRDTATPGAMSELLRKIWDGEVLNKKNTELLLDIMKRCETGENRIKGMLPPETVVYHKTGTIGGTTNDVGIIELPGDAGAMVAVLFVKEAEVETEESAKAIAQISRSLYDYFLYR